MKHLCSHSVFLTLFSTLIISNLAFSQQWRGLDFTFVGRDTFLYPYDGGNPKAKIRVVNTASSPSPTKVYSSVSSPEVPNPGGGFGTFPNGGYIYLAPQETTYVSCWLKAVYDSGPIPSGYFIRQIIFTFRRNDNADTSAFSISKTFVFNNIGDNVQLSGPLSVSGKVILRTLPARGPINVTVGTIHQVTAITTTQIDSGVQFSTTLPLRDDWYLKVSSDDFKTKYFRINPSSASNIRIELEPEGAIPVISFQLLKTVSTTTGFWRGAASESEKTVALFPGQENWRQIGNCADSAVVAQSKIYKYTFSGQLLWSYSTGWQTWGGDMTRDGKYVVYALNAGHFFGCYGPPNTVVLLNGVTGQKLWERVGPKIYESLEVIISNNSNYVAVGSGESGQVSLLDRTTGNVVWTVPQNPDTGFGQVRRMKFDANDEYLYAASGDNYLRKIRVSDGAIIWKAFIWGWAWVNGLNFSPDGSTIVAGTKSGDVTMVRTSDGKVLWSREPGNFEDVVFSLNGKLVATYTGKIFDALTGELIGQSRFGGPPYFANDSLLCKLLEIGIVVSGTSGDQVYQSSNPGITGGHVQWAYLSSDFSAILAGRDMPTPPQTGIVFYQGSITTGIAEDKASIPMTPELYQNYPNPFNPTTEIVFELATPGYTTLKVYNTLGQEVRTLVSEFLTEGMHTVQFTTSGEGVKDLPSGVYIYQLRSGSFNSARKMLLMK